MTKSIKSVNIIIRLDIEGNGLDNESIQEILDNMNYSFVYDDFYKRILNFEIVESNISSSKK